jgi:hypothetical protein
MKLNKQEIETKEYYILSWDIKNKDFYEESLNHFISAVEDRVAKENESFDYAFPEVTYVFADHIFKPARFSETFSGLKALECEFQKGVLWNGFRKLIKESFKHLKSSFFLVWLLVAVVLYAVYSFFSLKSSFSVMYWYKSNSLDTVSNFFKSNEEEPKDLRINCF